MYKKQENIENLINLLIRWQSIEDDSIRNTTEIIKKTNNPVLLIIMEIIRQDSALHRRMQQMIIDNYSKEQLCIDVDELQELWGLISEHDEAERKTIELAKSALERVEDPIVTLLLEYLLTDEGKHDKLLSDLEKYKENAFQDSQILPYI